MDCYCQVTFDYKGEVPDVCKTRVHLESGKTPVWNQTFTNIIKDNQKVMLEVFDQDFLK